ncbi:MAG TPA: arsenite methyltransferase [Sorangium sp.]|nr:arsenite methyltransferase [Sorangium sp.]
MATDQNQNQKRNTNSRAADGGCAPGCCDTTSEQTTGSKATTSVGGASANTIRDGVRAQYAKVARGTGGCCGPAGFSADSAKRVSRGIGYSDEQLDEVVEGANLGVGCGNPTAIANLSSGQVVVDLGSGAGLDALLAAKQVGPNGRVIGIDMTPEMLERARTNAVQAGHARNVEFREGVIEELPVASASVDVIISNCVINLSPEKDRVFREAYRVLRSGGKLVVSDILLSKPLPKVIADHAGAYAACVGGAVMADEYLQALRDAGFDNIEMSKRSAEGLMAATLDLPDIRKLAAALPANVLEDAMKSLWSYDIKAHKA